MKSKIGLLFLILAVTNCVSARDYFKDRKHDAMDMFELTGGFFTTNGLFECGAFSNIGPLLIGAGSKHQSFGLKGGELGSFENQGLVVLVGREAFYYDTDDIEKLLRIQFREKEFRDKSYQNASNYTRFSVGGGCILGVHVAVNVGEIFDFILGIVGLDLYGDDFYAKMPSHIREVLEKK
jgi:hypothetical protein